MNDMYINIGSEKACFFVKSSIFLVRKLKAKPVLYYAVEEALQCASQGYYAVGILTFAQLLNVFNQKTPQARHIVAHELLTNRPSTNDFNEIVEAVKHAAEQKSRDEESKRQDIRAYHESIHNEWRALMKELHGIEFETSGNN